MGNFLLFHNKKLMCRRSKFPKFCRRSQKTCKGRTSSLRPVTQEKVVLLLPSIFYRCCASVPHFLGGIGCLPSLCPMQGAPPLHPGHISFCEERNMEKKVVGGCRPQTPAYLPLPLNERRLVVLGECFVLKGCRQAT